MTDDPVLDAERYNERMERKWEEANEAKRCAICGRPCGMLKHYDFDGEIVCERHLLTAFRAQVIPEEILEDMAYEYEVMEG